MEEHARGATLLKTVRRKRVHALLVAAILPCRCFRRKQMEDDAVKLSKAVTPTHCAAGTGLVSGLVLGGFLLIAPAANGAESTC